MLSNAVIGNPGLLQELPGIPALLPQGRDDREQSAAEPELCAAQPGFIAALQRQCQDEGHGLDADPAGRHVRQGAD